MNKLQKLYLELIKLTQFNSLNGKQIYNDLLENEDIWDAVFLKDSDSLITLRDLPEGFHNVSTLYILTTEDKLVDLMPFVHDWSPDDVNVYKKDEVTLLLGIGNPGDKVIIELWWD